jgi:hypothetical protein
VILADFDFHPDEDAVRVFTVVRVPVTQVPLLNAATRAIGPTQPGSSMSVVQPSIRR